MQTAKQFNAGRDEMTTTTDRTCGNCGNQECKWHGKIKPIGGAGPMTCKPGWIPIPAPAGGEQDAELQALKTVARKALLCLYIAVESNVADDVNKKIKAYIEALEKQPAPQDILNDLASDIEQTFPPKGFHPNRKLADCKYCQITASIADFVRRYKGSVIKPAAQDIMAALKDRELAKKVTDSWDMNAVTQAIREYHAALLEKIKELQKEGA